MSWFHYYLLLFIFGNSLKNVILSHKSKRNMKLLMPLLKHEVKTIITRILANIKNW